MSDTTELAVIPETRIFPADPTQMVETAGAQAEALKRVIDDRGLYSVIQGRKYITVAGWQTLGAMVGVFPIVVWTRPTPDFQAPVWEFYRDGSRNKRRLVQDGQGGWESRVEARRPDGQVIGAAESECRWDETTWRNRDSYALRSMAQTRATSKALRIPLGFIVELAGYVGTPEEEMPESRAPAVSLEILPEGYDPVQWCKQVAYHYASANVERAETIWKDAVAVAGLDPEGEWSKQDAELVAEVLGDAWYDGLDESG